jgi:hypothetical protein
MPPPFIVNINIDNLNYYIYAPNKMLWESLNITKEDDLIGSLTSKTLSKYKKLILPCEISYGWVKENILFHKKMNFV